MNVSIARPFHLMLKPAGARCNLSCTYCYYLEKEALYPGSTLRMDDATLEHVTAAYLQTHPGPEVVFGWQGGEPLMMGLDFYRRAVELQKRHGRPGLQVVNTLQTNGTLVTDEWAKFFTRHDFLIGISMDGSPELHDQYRRDRGGKPSYDRVWAGLACLQRHKTEYNVLVTVNRANEKHPLTVYKHLTRLGVKHMQFIPIVERKPQGCQSVTDYSVRSERYGTFLCTIFDYWARHDVGKVFVQLFESALNVWLGGLPSVCVFAPACGHSLVVEHNGDLYACDHYVDREHYRGCIMTQSLSSLVESKSQQAFGLAKAALPPACRQCLVLRFCGGDCPKHRLGSTDEESLSYLCGAYRLFFTSSGAILHAMANEIRAGRPAAKVMEALRIKKRDV